MSVIPVGRAASRGVEVTTGGWTVCGVCKYGASGGGVGV